jgi:hypothetical protein
MVKDITTHGIGSFLHLSNSGNSNIQFISDHVTISGNKIIYKTFYITRFGRNLHNLQDEQYDLQIYFDFSLFHSVFM